MPWGRKSRKSTHCQQDPQSGQVHCEMNRITEEGQENLASVDFQFDGNCNPVTSDVQYDEDGNLDKMMSKVVPHLSNKCKNKPADY